MKKDSLIMRVLGRIVNGKKTKDKKVIRPATKQEIEKSYFDAWEEYQYKKSQMSPLEKQDAINNELWLNGQGG